MEEDPRIARLERRLARERAARKSAESIAEEQTLRLYEANNVLKDRQGQLQEALGYLHTILDHMADSLLVVDREGRVKLANRTLLRTFGLDGAQIVGRRCDAIFDADLSLRLRADGPADGPVEFELALPGDRVGLAALVAAEGLGKVAIIRDVTTAKEIDRMKTDFISNVSHELRTPLTSILGFTQIIRRNLTGKVFPALPADDRKVAKAVERVMSNLDIIIDEGARLTTLINDVLDLAKMEAGRVNLNMQEVSVAQLIERVTAATASLFETSGLELRCEVAPDLPSLEGDRDRLIQVLINLISNAAKFTAEGSVTCRAELQGSEIVVSVTDTGVGIAPDEIEKVFEKFKQVGETLTDKPKGTGLGLPISRQIVLHHGGRIWAESVLGEGSTFAFALPVEVTEEPKEQAWDGTSLDVHALMRRLAGHAPGPEPRAHKTVLVVDDERNIREYLKQELQAEHYEVLEAQNGLEAIRVAKEQRPDLIILDVMMPRMNGFDAAAVLKNDPRTARIPIMMHSIVEDRERGYRLGIDRYLAKPAETATLLEEVADLTGERDKTILVVGDGQATTPELVDTIGRVGAHTVELASGATSLERALDLRPDLIIIDTSVAEQQAVVQRLRAEKQMEGVPLFLLAEESGREE